MSFLHGSSLNLQMIEPSQNQSDGLYWDLCGQLEYFQVSNHYEHNLINANL